MSNQNTALPLQTLSDSGKAPKTRVKTARDAQSIVEALIDSNRDRARFNAKIKGMLDGNAPYDAAKLRAAAQSYRTNVNFMEGESALSAALVPYYDLFAGSQTYAEVRLRHDNPDEAAAKSQIVTEEFDALLKNYDDFEFNMHSVLHDYVAFGRGFVMFPKQWGWHFDHVSFSRIFVPDQTKASVRKLELCVIREQMQVHTLWGYVRNSKTAKEAGWNPDVVADAIRKAMPEDRESQTSGALSYEWVQDRMRDRDLAEGSKQPTVQAAHLLVKEFDGTVTHMIVAETQGPADSGVSSDRAPEPEFLFKKQGKFKNMREVLSAFFFETLNGSWNGSRGLGHKIYASMEIKNRLLCKITDNAFLSGGITLQAENPNALQKTNLVQAGDFNIIPPGYTVQSAQIFVNSQGLVGTNQLLDQTISSNTGIFKPKMEKPQGNPRTAKEVEIQYQNATVLSNSGVSRFYRQLDPLYTEIYRRVTHGALISEDQSEESQAVREFLKRCEERGVSREELRNVERVMAVRNIGNGSQAQRQQSLERFVGFIPMLPESGREAWMRDLVASEFGASAVNRYVPSREAQLRPNDHQSMALLENAAMRQGAPVAWTPTQNNVVHTVEHLRAMSGAIESLQSGADQVEVLGFLEAVGPHAQMHLAKLADDPSRKNEFKYLSEQFGQMASFADKLAAKIEQEQAEAAEMQQEQMMATQQAQAIEQGVDPETRIAMAKTKADLEMKRAKAEQMMRLKDAAARQKLAISDLRTAQDLRTKSMRARMNQKNHNNAEMAEK